MKPQPINQLIYFFKLKDNTHKNHSTANSKAISCDGMFKDANIITNVTMLELGTDGNAITATDVKILKQIKLLDYVYL